MSLHSNPVSPGEALFTADPEVMGGRLVFRGTRIPVEVLFENLVDGMSLDDILEAYPTLKRADAVAALELAARPLTAVGTGAADAACSCFGPWRSTRAKNADLSRFIL